MSEDIRVEPGSDNVFGDLGFDAEEAVNLKIRSDLLLDLRSSIQEKGPCGPSLISAGPR